MFAALAIATSGVITLKAEPAPEVSIAKSVMLSWPGATAEEYVPVRTEKLGDPWVPVPEPIFTRNGACCVVVPITHMDQWLSPSEYFTLVPGHQFSDDFGQASAAWLSAPFNPADASKFIVTYPDERLRIQGTGGYSNGRLALTPADPNPVLGDVTASIDIVDWDASADQSIGIAYGDVDMGSPSASRAYVAVCTFMSTSHPGKSSLWLWEQSDVYSGYLGIVQYIEPLQTGKSYRLSFSLVGDRATISILELGNSEGLSVSHSVTLPAPVIDQGSLGLYFQADPGSTTHDLTLDNFIVTGTESETAPPPPPPPPPNWTLVWSDEFDGPDIDLSKWSHEVNAWGGGNNELQYYTDRPTNSFIQDGCLVIQALDETYTGPEGTREYTSARLSTVNKGDWTYGRFEARIKLPFGQGLWPAFWMLPTAWVYGGWPASGEIDIMELVGHEPNKVYGTIHFGGEWSNTVSSGNSWTLPSGGFWYDFHVFAVEWQEGVMRWYVDDILYSTKAWWWTDEGSPFPAPFDQDFHILLNVAVGGDWPGSPDATTVFPQQMVVDYVRVYAEVE